MRMTGAASAEVGGGELLNHFARLHDADDWAEMGDHGEVVADQDISEAAPLLEVGEEVENFGLDGDVEGTGGFVEQQHVGLGH